MHQSLFLSGITQYNQNPADGRVDDEVSDDGDPVSVTRYLFGVLGSRFKLHGQVAEAMHKNWNPDRSAIDH